MNATEEIRIVERALQSVEMAISDLSRLQGYDYSLKNLVLLAKHLNNEITTLSAVK